MDYKLYYNLMIYFSEIKGAKVATEDEVTVGRLADMIFLTEEHPKITKIVIKSPRDPSLIVPVSAITKINGGVYLAKNYSLERLDSNEMYLMKNLLDTQIIDIRGSKIVRVNDVIIAEKPDYHIAGVDIGLIGILRWLRLEDAVNRFLKIFGSTLTQSYLSWGDIQPLELGSGRVKIKKEEKRLEKIRPEDLADYLERTNILNVKNILNIIDEKKAAEVIGQLNISYQTNLFKQFKSSKIAKLLRFLDPEDAVDILLTLPKKKRESVIDLLEPEQRQDLEYLITLSKTPIGEILTTEYLAVDSALTVRQVIEKIKQETSDFHTLSYVYVVNREEQLVGVCNLHELLLRSPDMPIYKFMIQNLVVAYLTTPEFVVFKKMVKYQLYAIPVVDRDKRILGIVNFDDIVDLVSNERE